MEGHGDSYEVGRHLAAFGRAHHNAGDGARALELCSGAARKFGETEYNGQEEAPAGNLETLGDIYLGLGRHDEAVESYERALAVWRGMRDGTNSADCLIMLGKAFIAAGRPGRGRDALVEALELIDATRDAHNFDSADLQEARDLIASVKNV
ncbi:tetratricopeptide repeat protein [Lentzea pudingi]|uniref:tetratricopeptide repeat protein n=1 Tax=Lentzea pudingi TaxID=1789439 RepID=UPI0035713540